MYILICIYYFICIHYLSTSDSLYHSSLLFHLYLLSCSICTFLVIPPISFSPISFYFNFIHSSIYIFHSYFFLLFPLHPFHSVSSLFTRSFEFYSPISVSYFLFTQFRLISSLFTSLFTFNSPFSSFYLIPTHFIFIYSPIYLFPSYLSLLFNFPCVILFHLYLLPYLPFTVLFLPINSIHLFSFNFFPSPSSVSPPSPPLYDWLCPCLVRSSVRTFVSLLMSPVGWLSVLPVVGVS